MQVRNVGSNGIKVSGISLGLMGLGWHSQKQMEDNIKLAFNLGNRSFLFFLSSLMMLWCSTVF